jgi:phosphoglycerate dehydrogenase-like enzyme
MKTVLYLCPLGQQHRDWRMAAAPPDLNVIMRRSTEVSREEILSLIPQADALITERVGAIDRGMIEAGKSLKIIQRLGSLYHDIDLEAARERNIPVCTRPIRGVIAVAENMMLMVLGVLRRAMPLQQVVRTEPTQFKLTLPLGPNNKAQNVPFVPRRTSEDVFAFNWSGQTQVRLLHNKTVGILGFGEIGAELARRLQPWNCRVLYAKRHKLPEFIEKDLRIAYRSQEDILRESDIVVSLLPYFKETDMWLNAHRISTMKRGAFLCHAGSGSVIDEAAVAEAVRSGHLAGASFDTFEWEPIKQDNPLLALANADPDANVFLLPHIGSCNDSDMSEFTEFYGNVWNALNSGPIAGRI